MAGFNPNQRAEATTVTGSRGPENENAVRLVADVEDKIYLWMPASTPLTVLTGKVKGSRTVHQYKFDVLSQDEMPRSVELSEAALVNDTSLVLLTDQGDRIPTYAVLLNLRTEESVYVTLVSNDTLTVERGIGSAQQDMAAGDQLVFTRAVFEDGSGKGDFKTVQVDDDFNYTEIVKTGYGFTGRQENTEFYGGSDVDSTRKWAGIEHRKSLELAFFFGRRHLRTGTHLTTFTGGIDQFIRTNRWNVQGTDPTEDSFLEVLEETMRWGKGGNLQTGSAVKYAFSSSRWLTKLQRWAGDKIRIEQSESTLGIKMARYQSAHGDVMFIKTPILDYYHPDRMYILDLNHIDKVNHRGRGTRIYKNIQDPDLDGFEEQYQSDTGVQVTLEASHLAVSGLGK